MIGKSSMLDRLVVRYTEFLLTRRRWFVIATLVGMAAAAAFIPRITFDNTPDSFFLEGDRTLIVYDRFKDLFASDEYSLIVIDAPPRWTPTFIEQVRDLQTTLEGLPHVRKVTAITNVRHIQGNPEGIEVGDFLPPGVDDEALADKRTAAMRHPYYRDLFVSSDGQHLGVIVETEIIKGDINYKIALTRQIRDLLEREPYRNWDPKAVGAPILDADVRDIVSRESSLFGFLAFALIGIGFLFVFRSLLGMALPIGIALCSIVVSFGIMGMIGAPVGLLTPVIPSFLISVGVGTCVYLMTHLYSTIQKGPSVREAIIESMQVAGVPGIMAAVTTSSALLAFSSSRIAPVQDVGIVMGLGLLVALVLTLVFLPLAFSLYRTVPNSKRRNELIEGRVRWLQRICELVLRWPNRVLLSFFVVLILAGIGIVLLNSDYYYLGNFKKGVRIRQDYEAVDRTIKASSAIEVLVKGPAEDAFKYPEMLQALEKLQTHIDDYAAIPTKTYSLADVVKEINQALYDGDSAFYRIPDSQPAIAQALLLFESSGHDELTRVASPDYAIARLTVRVPSLPDSEYHPLVESIRGFSAQEFDRLQLAAIETPRGQTIDVTITGLVPMWMKISSYLTESQIKALIISGMVITLVMMGMFRSMVLGILMSGINASVVILVLGIMGWFEIALDPYTILVASIALGILDDDTLHFVKHIQYELSQVSDLKAAIRSAYYSTGQAMFYTTAVLVFGFAIYSLSAVTSLTKFGLLVSLTLILGLCAEYLITPALLLLLDRYGLLKVPGLVPTVSQVSSDSH